MKFHLSRFDLDALHQLKELLDNNFKTGISLNQWAYKTGMDEQKLKNGFRQLTGFSVAKYVCRLRIAFAQECLLDDYRSIKEIASLSGFGGIDSFNRAFKRIIKQTPGEWKRNNYKFPVYENDSAVSV